jgi:hypothetical protein
MIKFSDTVYLFDPVQCVFHKDKYQNNFEASNQFPDRLRLEKRQIEYLSCDLVLTQYNGVKWNLITGLQPVRQMPGIFTGNKKLFNIGKTEMLVIHNNGLTGVFHLYHFPNYDTKTARQRIKAAKDFILFLNKKKGNRGNDRPDIFTNINAGQI